MTKFFFKDVASTGRLKQDFERDIRVAGLDDITPAKVLVIDLIYITNMVIAIKKMNFSSGDFEHGGGREDNLLPGEFRGGKCEFKLSPFCLQFMKM